MHICLREWLRMDLKSIAQRIGRGELHYVLGRFRTVRVSYSKLQRFRHLVSRARVPDLPDRATMFPDVDVGLATRQIEKEAVYLGLRLPERIIAEIDAFGRAEPLHTR